MTAEQSANTITKQAEAIKRLSRIVDLLMNECSMSPSLEGWVQKQIDDINPSQFLPKAKETM